MSSLIRVLSLLICLLAMANGFKISSNCAARCKPESGLKDCLCRCGEFKACAEAVKSISLSRRLIDPAVFENKVKDDTDPNWEAWCKKQCAEGMGGSACYCDIIP